MPLIAAEPRSRARDAAALIAAAAAARDPALAGPMNTTAAVQPPVGLGGAPEHGSAAWVGIIPEPESAIASSTCLNWSEVDTGSREENASKQESSSLLKNLGNLSFFVSVARLIRCQVLCSLA